MKTMRVLHLRKGAGFFGAERIILSLTQGLTNKNQHAWVGCLYDHRQPCLQMIDRAKEKQLPTEVFHCRSYIDPTTIQALRQFVLKNQVDVIHCHGFKADVFGWVVAKFTKTPLVATKHGWTQSNRWIRFWEWLDLFFLKSFDSVVVVSEQMRKKLVEKNFPKEKLLVVRNGIAIHNNGPINEHVTRQTLGIHQNDLVVGIVGRLSIEKGHRLFIDAARNISSRHPSTKFLIVGDGLLRNELESYVRSLKLNNVIFTGYRSDVHHLLDMMDIVVSTSMREGVPLALLEAMAAKKPIVATAVGGVRKIVQQAKTGFLVPLNDLKTLTKRIRQLLNDEKLRTSLGKQAHQYVSDYYSSERMVEAYLSLYQDLINNHRCQ